MTPAATPLTPPTPRTLGYRMPAEWEPQAAVWLAWPHNLDTWPRAQLEAVRRAYADFILAVHTGEKVCLLVNDAESESQASGVLAGRGIDMASVQMFRIPTCDTWIRDYGPTFVSHARSGETAMVQWVFNAWGDKYDDLKADDGVGCEINRALDMMEFAAGVVLEGGSIDVNGRGSVLTTEQCLLNPNRNPGLSRADIETVLQDYLSVSHVIWLGEGIAGDDTDGHIDDVARFVGEGTVVCAFESDPADENHAPLLDNYNRLMRARDQDGARLNVIQLPMPGPVAGPGGRLPASYVNFYIGNDTVLVPVFGHSNDRRALNILETCFPNRRVVGIDCQAMVHGFGTLHCSSQQQPLAAPLAC